MAVNAKRHHWHLIYTAIARSMEAMPDQSIHLSEPPPFAGLYSTSSDRDLQSPNIIPRRSSP